MTPVMPATKPAASCLASSLARAVSILAVLLFSENGNSNGRGSSILRAMLISDDLSAAWTEIPPAAFEDADGLRYEVSRDFLFGLASSPESEGPLQQRAERLYKRIFALMAAQGRPHALRFWNYVPRLNQVEDGLERYRAFNWGRHAAFESAGRLAAGSIPAACALGMGEDALRVYFLAARFPGHAIENPRQVNAYRYPREYGPRSPTFARALAYPAEAPTLLFVSGTASIVGHETLHAGDAGAQADETLANLEAVFAQASRLADFPMREAQFKAYVRHDADLPVVRAALAARLGENARIAYLRADICRADLLVEVEGFCRSSP